MLDECGTPEPKGADPCKPAPCEPAPCEPAAKPVPCEPAAKPAPCEPTAKPAPEPPCAPPPAYGVAGPMEEKAKPDEGAGRGREVLIGKGIDFDEIDERLPGVAPK